MKRGVVHGALVCLAGAWGCPDTIPPRVLTAERLLTICLGRADGTGAELPPPPGMWRESSPTVDGWGRPWVESPRDSGIETVSRGADGELGTPDDMRLPVIRRGDSAVCHSIYAQLRDGR